MKSKIFSVLGIFTVVGALLFSLNASAADTAATKEQKQKDGEIIAFLITLNKNEIAAAKKAMKKAKTASVKKYAAMLNKEHTKNLAETLKVSKKIGIAPNNTAAVVQLQQNGKEELVGLEALKGNEFDKAYIDAMVKDHTDALNLIDTNLLANVTNPDLKAQIEATRPHIAAHLQEGQTIQTQLNQSTN